VLLSGSSLLATDYVVAATNGEGDKLFQRNCAACHGSTGEGGVGVPIALPAFIDSVDDVYLGKTIRLGRPGRVMPAFTHFSDHEIDAIVAYMRTWTGHQPPPYGADPVRGSALRGAQLYQTNCAACHGARGEGGHGTGVTFSRPRDLPILAPALNNPGFLGAASDAMIKNTLMKGREGTPMTSFLKRGLREQDVNDVVAFVRSFEKSPLSRPTELGSSEPPIIVRESPNDFDRTLNALKEAISTANMRLIRIQYLDQGLVPEGQENRKQVIVYSCGFNFLNEALKIDPRVGVFLPCRVTVVEREGKVYLMAINPKRLAIVFNNAELDVLCDKMHQTYVNMLEEATF
jgi:cytochrome c oxidase cbb3-type subunit 3